MIGVMCPLTEDILTITIRISLLSKSLEPVRTLADLDGKSTLGSACDRYKNLIKRPLMLLGGSSKFDPENYQGKDEGFSCSVSRSVPTLVRNKPLSIDSRFAHAPDLTLQHL